MRERERERRKLGELRRVVFVLDLGIVSIQVQSSCFVSTCLLT